MRNRGYHLSGYILALAAALAMVLPGGAQPGPDSSRPLSPRDSEFLNDFAQDNQAEIQASLLAEKKAEMPATKAFARLMVYDHSAAENQLAILINAENVEVPNGIGQEGAQTISKLESTPRAKFDSEFIQEQVKYHTKDIERLREMQSKTQNPQLRQFVTDSLRTLQQHLALAHAVEAALPKESQTTGSAPPQRTR
jgi:putative membrane protein